MIRVSTAVSCEGHHTAPAKLSLAFGLLLVTCLQAVAQESFVSPRPNLLSISARLEVPRPPAAFKPSLPRLAPAPTPRFSVRVEAPLRLKIPTYSGRTNWPAPPDSSPHNHSSALESAIGLTRTPFAERVNLPLASISGGQFELGGFYSYRATENVLLGLPGGGSLPAWSVSQQAHPGVTVPLADASYGLSVLLRMKRGRQPGPRLHVWRCLAWVVGAGSGCYSAASGSAAR